MKREKILLVCRICDSAFLYEKTYKILKHLGIAKHQFKSILYLCIANLMLSCAGGVSTGLLPEGIEYHCTTDIEKCTKYSRSVTVEVLHPKPQCYKVVHNYKSLTGQKFLYCDRNWEIFNATLKTVNGAHLIQTRYEDRNLSSADEYLKIRVNDIIEGVYIAFDSRATSKPKWLKEQFYLLRDENTRKPFYILTGIPDNSQSAPAIVKLEIWRNIKDVSQLKIGNNSSDGAKWPSAVPVDEKAMYVVLINPKEEISPLCWPNNKLYYKTPKFPYGSNEALLEANAVKEAIDDAKNKYPGTGNSIYKADLTSTTCKKVLVYPKISTTTHPLLQISSKSFIRHSEVSFSKLQSHATIKIKKDGKTKSETLPVWGKIHFEYEFDNNLFMQTMQINSVVLHFNPVNTDVGNFKKITASVLTPFSATCADSPAPIANPCNNYTIKTGAMIFSIDAEKDDGGLLLAIAENTKPVNVQIDHKNRIFHLGGPGLVGPFKTKIKIDGDDIPVEINIDLTGFFENFAPTAKAKAESPTIIECDEHSNAKPFMLYAGASFDIYPTQPPINYEWYEDYGLVTEKFWGNTDQLKIWPHQLEFGVHNLTLVVRDAAQVVDTASIKLQVVDSTPPKFLIFPPDVYALSLEGKPMKLQIGEASATDVCYPNVFISNDAPHNLVFPPGKTEVNWVADDGRGNLTKAVQNVFVFVPITFLSEIKNVLLTVNNELERMISSIENYTDDLRWNVDIESLNGIIKHYETSVKRISIQKEKKEDVSKMIGNLKRIRDGLNNAETLLKEASKSEDRTTRFQLLSEAKLHIEKSSGLIEDLHIKK